MSRWVDDGIYHWFEWSQDDTDYDYAVRVACNNYEDISGESKSALFNILTDSPNANPPSGYTKFISLTGPISSTTYGTHAYNLGGPTTTYSYQVKQVAWESTPRDYDYLTMYSWGGANMYFKTINEGANASMADIVIGCSAKANGVGEAGCSTRRSHAFIGAGTSSGSAINYMGYTTGTDGSQSSGALGSEIVAKMTGLYGGRCAILDGGGSTQMYYDGSVVRSSTDGAVRKLQTAIQLYRKEKPAPVVTYTITTIASPSTGGSISGGGTYDSGTSITLVATANTGYTFLKWDDDVTESSRNVVITEDKTYTAIFKKDASIDNDDTGTVHGQIKINGKVLERLAIDSNKAKTIYMMKSGAMTPIVKSYNIKYNVNGGSTLNNDNYFYGAGKTLSTPTHADYESRQVLFNGWFKDAAFTDQTLSLGLNASGDRELYAKWKQSKTQYSGYYTVGSGSDSVTLEDSGYSGNFNTNMFLCDNNSNIYDHDVTITYVHCNVDICLASGTSYTEYVKPELHYGYYTTPGSYTTFVDKGKGSDKGSAMDTSCSYVLPAGSTVGFKLIYPDSIVRNKIYYYSGGYTYSGAVTKHITWQDSSTPPEGSWDSGYPLTRNVSRYYDGSDWTDWSV